MRRPAKPDSLMIVVAVFGLGTLLTATLQAALG